MRHILGNVRHQNAQCSTYMIICQNLRSWPLKLYIHYRVINLHRMSGFVRQISYTDSQHVIIKY